MKDEKIEVNNPRHNMNVEFERIEISITAGSQVVDNKHATEINHKCVIGIALAITDTAALPGSALELKIDNLEIFPSGFEAKMLYASEDVPPADRFMPYVNRNIDQSEVKYKYTDGNNADHVTYTAVIYLMCIPK